MITRNAEKVIRDSGCSIIDSDIIDWEQFPRMKKKQPKELFPHQKEAVQAVLKGFGDNDRGKLLMACGTGKTLTSLRIAEKHAGTGGLVLYAVPSISLILQSMRSWSDNANIPHNYIAVCSDESTGEDAYITELESKVTTDYSKLQESLNKQVMTVIFSTYHSLDVVKKAMSEEWFDLILADEAHRTTGVEDKSFFTKVHKSVPGKKRLYMTATPRVYSDVIKAKMGKLVYSMVEERFGPVFYNLTFPDAVRKGILSDFRVKIAIVPADKDFQQSISIQNHSSTGDLEMPLDERTLLAAVWHGLNHPDDEKKPRLLKKVIAFTNRIDRSKMFAGDKTDDIGHDRSLGTIVEQYELRVSAQAIWYKSVMWTAIPRLLRGGRIYSGWTIIRRPTPILVGY